MQHHGQIFRLQTPLEIGSKGKNSIFQNMVMLHIKLNGITKYSIMLADILPQTLPLRLWGQKIKLQLF